MLILDVLSNIAAVIVCVALWVLETLARLGMLLIHFPRATAVIIAGGLVLWYFGYL